MLIVNKSEESITGVFNGDPFNIPFDEKVYKALKKNEVAYATTKDVETLNEATEKLLVVNYSTLITDKNPYLMYNPAKGEYFLIINKDKKNEKVSDIPIPETLVEKIQYSFDNDLDYMPIIKAWKNFLISRMEIKENGGFTLTAYDKFIENTRYFANFMSTQFIDNDETNRLMEEEGLELEIAIERATYQDISITREGVLAGYKVAEEVTEKFELVYEEDGALKGKKKVSMYPSKHEIDEVTGDITTTKGEAEHHEDRYFKPAIWTDGEDFYCDGKLGQKYRIGSIQKLPRTATVNRNNTSMGGGLYIGGLNYIRNYGGSTTKTLSCFINPADIISFQNDGNAIRVWRLFPNDVIEDSEVKLKGIYHSSKYLEDTLTELEDEMKIAVTVSKEDTKKSDLEKIGTLDMLKNRL